MFNETVDIIDGTLDLPWIKIWYGNIRCSFNVDKQPPLFQSDNGKRSPTLHRVHAFAEEPYFSLFATAPPKAFSRHIGSIKCFVVGWNFDQLPSRADGRFCLSITTYVHSLFNSKFSSN